MTSSMDDSDDEFDQLAPPDNELDKVHVYIIICHTIHGEKQAKAYVHTSKSEP